MMSRVALSCLACVLTMSVGACGDDGAPGNEGGMGGEGVGGAGGTGGTPPSLTEVYDLGLTRFVDAFTPVDEDPVPNEAGVKQWTFEAPADPSMGTRGPLCLRGGAYTTDTRAGSSDELMIFLQGGGACWEAFCSATETAGSITVAGILDPNEDDNPLANHDVVYLPYCDGSLFAGDVDRDLPASILGEGNGVAPGYQRGLQNLTASLDIAAREFPNPSRVILAGISGGAFGTITAAPLVRSYYPGVDILVLNDSGIGVAKRDTPEFVADLLEEWNAIGWVPPSCVDCFGNGHVTNLIDWNLRADPLLSISAISHSTDSVIAAFFLMIDSAVFTETLLSETERLGMLFPDRYKRFIIPGDPHTVLLNFGEPQVIGGLATLGTSRTEIDGTSALEWVRAMLDGTDAWENLVDASLIATQ